MRDQTSAELRIAARRLRSAQAKLAAKPASTKRAERVAACRAELSDLLERSRRTPVGV